MKLKLTEEIWKEGNMYVSYCPELDIASCGEDVQQAKKNLCEAILINIKEIRKMGTFQEFLKECGIDRLAPRKPRPLGRGQGELYKNAYLPYREAPPFKAGSFTYRMETLCMLVRNW